MSEEVEVAPGAEESRTRPQFKALLLTCMDARLMAHYEPAMQKRGLHGDYDHVILAGAALGAVSPQRPAWAQTFWEHLDLAINLHGIQTVILIDHMDCAAYEVLLGGPAASTEDEVLRHARFQNDLREEILRKYPKLLVQRFLMSLDGSLEELH